MRAIRIQCRNPCTFALYAEYTRNLPLYNRILLHDSDPCIKGREDFGAEKRAISSEPNRIKMEGMKGSVVSL